MTSHTTEINLDNIVNELPLDGKVVFYHIEGTENNDPESLKKAHELGQDYLSLQKSWDEKTFAFINTFGLNDQAKVVAQNMLNSQVDGEEFVSAFEFKQDIMDKLGVDLVVGEKFYDNVAKNIPIYKATTDTLELVKGVIGKADKQVMSEKLNQMLMNHMTFMYDSMDKEFLKNHFKNLVGLKDNFNIADNVKNELISLAMRESDLKQENTYFDEMAVSLGLSPEDKLKYAKQIRDDSFKEGSFEIGFNISDKWNIPFEDTKHLDLIQNMLHGKIHENGTLDPAISYLPEDRQNNVKLFYFDTIVSYNLIDKVKNFLGNMDDGDKLSPDQLKSGLLTINNIGYFNFYKGKLKPEDQEKVFISIINSPIKNNFNFREIIGQEMSEELKEAYANKFYSRVVKYNFNPSLCELSAFLDWYGKEDTKIHQQLNEQLYTRADLESPGTYLYLAKKDGRSNSSIKEYSNHRLFGLITEEDFEGAKEFSKLLSKEVVDNTLKDILDGTSPLASCYKLLDHFSIDQKVISNNAKTRISHLDLREDVNEISDIEEELTYASLSLPGEEAAKLDYKMFKQLLEERPSFALHYASGDCTHKFYMNHESREVLALKLISQGHYDKASEQIKNFEVRKKLRKVDNMLSQVYGLPF